MKMLKKHHSVKKFLALFLAFALLITMTPNVYAEDTEETNIAETVESEEGTESIDSTETENETPVEEVMPQSDTQDEEVSKQEVEIKDENETTSQEEPQETEEIIETEIPDSQEDENIMTVGADITPPVVTDFVFVENGQEVEDDYIHFTFKVEDADGSEISKDNSKIYISGNGFDSYHSIRSIIDNGDGTYTAEADCSVLTAGSYVITEAIISDAVGNMTYVPVKDNSDYLYTFTKVKKDDSNNKEDSDNDETIDTYTITDISLDTSEVLLDEEHLSEKINITVEIAEQIKYYSIVLNFSKYSRDTVQSGTYVDFDVVCEYDFESNSFKGVADIGVGQSAGIYKLEDAHFQYARDCKVVLECDVPSVNIQRNFKDVTGPQLKEVYFTKNGEKVENGFKAASSDEVKICISFDEKIEGDLSLALRTDAPNIAQTYHSLYSWEWNETSKMYEKTLDLENWYPTEWYISDFNVHDQYYNYNNEYDTNLQKNFFYLEKDGVCVIPERNVSVIVDTGNDRIHKNVILYSKVTTLSELFSGELSDINIENDNFLGWGFYNTDTAKYELFDMNEEFIVGSSLYIRAMYDKVPVTVSLSYIGEDESYEELSVLVKSDTTYEEVCEMYKDYEVNHLSGMQFKEWKCENNTDKEVSFGDTIRLKAEYSNTCLKARLYYYNENNSYSFVDRTFFVEAGTTVGEFLQTTDLGITHSVGCGFIGWNVDKDKVIESGEYSLYASAEYSNVCLEIKASYYNENNKLDTANSTFFVKSGTTVGEFLQTMELGITHSKDCEFIGWDADKDKIINSGKYYLNISAVYDNIPITVYLSYVGEDTYYEEISTFVKSGTTYGDLYEMYKDYEVNHLSGMQFVDWNYDGNADKEISLGNTMRLTAEYSNSYLRVWVYYYNENNEYDTVSSTFFVEAGTSVKDFLKTTDFGITHSAELGFVDWKFNESWFGDTIESGRNYLTITAEYEKYPVSYTYTYMATDGSTKEVAVDTLVKKGTTISDIINEIVLPSDALKSTVDGWVLTAGSINDEISSSLRFAIAKKYEGYLPIAIDLEHVNSKLEYVDTWHFYYLEDIYSADGITDSEIDIIREMIPDIVEKLSWDIHEDFQIKEITNYYSEGYDIEDSVNSRAYIFYAYAKTDKVLAIFSYPDGTEKRVALEKESVYQLPSTYRGYEVKWVGYDVDECYEEIEIDSELKFTVEKYWQTIELEATFVDENVKLDPPVDDDTDDTPNNPIIPSEPSDTPESGDTPTPDNGTDNVPDNTPNVPTTPSEPSDTPESGDTPTPDNGTTDNVPDDTPSTPNVPNAPTTPSKPSDKPENGDTKSEPVTLPSSVIEEKVNAITEAEKGSSIVIDMQNPDGTVATVVPVEVLETARGKDVNVVLDMGGYSWTINGMDIMDIDLKAINLEVTMDTNAVAPSVVNMLANGEPTRQLSLTHNGDFGFKASLTLNVGSEYEGQYGNLYYHDSTGKLVFMNAGEIDANGNVTLDFSHASDYVLVMGRDRTKEETENPSVPETPQEDTDKTKTDVTSPKTSTGTFEHGMFAMMAILTVIIAAAGIALVIRKKSEIK